MVKMFFVSFTIDKSCVACVVSSYFFLRRECSWNPPPDATLQSTSWSSWTTPRKAGDDDPTTVETPSSQAAAVDTTAASVEVAVVANEGSAGVAPREGVSLGHGGVANSAAVGPSADEGGGGASAIAAAAGDEGAFFGDSADNSGTYASGGQRSTAVQV